MKRQLHPPMRWLRAGLLTGMGLWCAVPTRALAAAPGSGDTDSSTWVNYEPPKSERRGGFTMGLSLGSGLSDFTGYPLVAADLGNPDAQASTGTGFGSSFAFWLGGTPRDWLSVALGFAFSSARGNEVLGSLGAPFFRVEVFPFYPLGGGFRDLGLSLDAGGAFGGIVDPDDSSEWLADGGSMGLLSFGVFYQPWSFWQMSTGPSLNYSHAFSQTMETNSLLLGWRLDFYGVQPKTTKSDASAHRRGSAAHVSF